MQREPGDGGLFQRCSRIWGKKPRVAIPEALGGGVGPEGLKSSPGWKRERAGRNLRVGTLRNLVPCPSFLAPRSWSTMLLGASTSGV